MRVCVGVCVHVDTACGIYTQVMFAFEGKSIAINPYTHTPPTCIHTHHTPMCTHTHIHTYTYPPLISLGSLTQKPQNPMTGTRMPLPKSQILMLSNQRTGWMTVPSTFQTQMPQLPKIGT